MKKANKPKAQPPRDDMRREYDFRSGVRGKYAASVAADTQLVILAPDVAAEFPTSASVNKALRALMKARKKRRTA